MLCSGTVRTRVRFEVSSKSESEDFASAAMMRLVACGLARQGISLPIRVPRGAHVSRVMKRDTLLAVLTSHGPAAIVRIADAIRHMAPEPLLQALAKARDAGDLFDRWRRLESFSHARHQVVVETAGSGSFHLYHRARDNGPEPTQAETLLVVSVLASLAERACARNLRFGPKGGSLWRRDGQWSTELDAPESKRFVLAGIDVSLKTEASPPNPTAANFVDTLRARVAADPVRRWTVAALAALAGMTPRTLQRRLTIGGTSVSRLVAEARLQIAAEYLCHRSGPGLVEIGYLSGYADQAHFTRSFSAAVGTSPRAYRSSFAG